MKADRNQIYFLYLIVTLLFFHADFNLSVAQSQDQPSPSEPQQQLQQYLTEADMYFINGKYTSPQGKNAYELYRKVLSIDPSNTHALGKTYEILKIMLNFFSQDVRRYGELLKEEAQGRNIGAEIIQILSEMISKLGDCAMICLEYPVRDPQTDQLCQMLSQNKEKYSKLHSFYLEKIKAQ